MPMIVELPSCGLVNALPGYARRLRDFLRDRAHVPSSPPYKTAPDSQKWRDSPNRTWMRPHNVGAARATLTREDSEWSRKFEKPWQV
jgi:hypothetical protein